MKGTENTSKKIWGVLVQTIFEDNNMEKITPFLN